MLLTAYRNIRIFAERVTSEWYIAKPSYDGNVPKFKILMWDDKCVESVLETVTTEQKDVYAYNNLTKKNVLNGGGFMGWIVRKEDFHNRNSEPIPVLCKSIDDMDEGVSDASRKTDEIKHEANRK